MNSNDMELLNDMTSNYFNFSDHQDVEPDQLPIPAGAVDDHNVENTFYPNHPQFYDNSYECNNRRPVENLTNSRLIGGEKANRSDNHGGRKRKRNNEREAEKPKEVVHVRAKRGQATDSHSLAERLRREKINEKLRSLQDLVPGCYKTMGMAVMLDVIINYVRSLQNQIEFLSMKLSAASLFYDFNSSEMDALETMQGTNGHETRVMVGDGYGGPGVPQFQSWPL